MNKQLQDLLITIVAGMGMLLSTLDTGIINIALPFLKEQFQTSTDIAAFTITAVSYTHLDVYKRQVIFFISRCKIYCVSSKRAPVTEKNKLIIFVSMLSPLSKYCT